MMAIPPIHKSRRSGQRPVFCAPCVTPLNSSGVAWLYSDCTVQPCRDGVVRTEE